MLTSHDEPGRTRHTTLQVAELTSNYEAQVKQLQSQLEQAQKDFVSGARIDAEEFQLCMSVTRCCSKQSA